jgi:hypothetical protein
MLASAAECLITQKSDTPLPTTFASTDPRTHTLTPCRQHTTLRRCDVPVAAAQSGAADLHKITGLESHGDRIGAQHPLD